MKIQLDVVMFEDNVEMLSTLRKFGLSSTFYRKDSILSIIIHNKNHLDAIMKDLFTCFYPRTIISISMKYIVENESDFEYLEEFIESYKYTNYGLVINIIKPKNIQKYIFNKVYVKINYFDVEEVLYDNINSIYNIDPMFFNKSDIAISIKLKSLEALEEITRFPNKLISNNDMCQAFISIPEQELIIYPSIVNLKKYLKRIELIKEQHIQIKANIEIRNPYLCNSEFIDEHIMPFNSVLEQYPDVVVSIKPHIDSVNGNSIETKTLITTLENTLLLLENKYSNIKKSEWGLKAGINRNDIKYIYLIVEKKNQQINLGADIESERGETTYYKLYADNENLTQIILTLLLYKENNSNLTNKDIPILDFPIFADIDSIYISSSKNKQDVISFNKLISMCKNIDLIKKQNLNWFNKLRDIFVSNAHSYLYKYSYKKQSNIFIKIFFNDINNEKHHEYQYYIDDDNNLQNNDDYIEMSPDNDMNYYMMDGNIHSMYNSMKINKNGLKLLSELEWDIPAEFLYSLGDWGYFSFDYVNADNNYITVFTFDKYIVHYHNKHKNVKNIVNS